MSQPSPATRGPCLTAVTGWRPSRRSTSFATPLMLNWWRGSHADATPSVGPIVARRRAGNESCVRPRSRTNATRRDQTRPVPQLTRPQFLRFRFVTELLHCPVSSMTCGATDEVGVAGAVKSPGLVVGTVGPGEQRKYRILVPALPRVLQ